MERSRWRRCRAVGPIAALLTVALALPALATAAPREGSDPGRTKEFVWGSGSEARPYLMYTPTSYNRRHAAPMIVMVHGCMTTADEQMRANLYNRLAERAGFVVVYPDVDEALTKLPQPLTNCWRFYDPNSIHRNSGDAAAIAGITREAMKRKRIDPERVYLMGMSAGGFMTSILSAAYPDIYAASGIMAAGAYADPTCLAGNPVTLSASRSAELAYAEMGSRARVVPRIVLGGDSDRGITPPCADKALEQGLRTNNLVIGGRQLGPVSLKPSSVRRDVRKRRYDSTVKSYRDPNGCLVGRRWLIHGMDHFWSGGSKDPDLANFTDPKGPSAAKISWRFFRKYTRSRTGMPCAEARGKGRRGKGKGGRG